MAVKDDFTLVTESLSGQKTRRLLMTGKQQQRQRGCLLGMTRIIINDKQRRGKKEIVAEKDDHHAVLIKVDDIHRG